jgi:hypothetical protein
MKKSVFIILATVALAAAASCNNDMAATSRMGESGATQRNNRSKRTVIDAGKFVNFSEAKNNAREAKKEDVLYTSYGEFQIDGGNSVIKINRQEGTITLISDSATFGGSEGVQFYAKYRFEVSAANSDCLYIKPDGKEA